MKDDEAVNDEAVNDEAVNDEAMNDEAMNDEVIVDLDVDVDVDAPSEARRAVEAILMVADQPVDPVLLAQLLELSPGAVADLCDGLAAAYRADGRGFELVQVAGGYRFRSHGDMAAYVERFALEGQAGRLSGAALETLAIVAYKQPISRAQIALIRGVNVDGVIRTLAQKGYIAEIGTDPGPGQAVLFGTTPTFLEGVGLNSLADLAPLGDFVPGSEVMEALEAGLRIDRQDTAPAAAGAAYDDDGIVVIADES